MKVSRARGQQLIGGNWSPRDLLRNSGSQRHSKCLFAFLRVCSRKATRLISINLYLLSLRASVRDKSGQTTATSQMKRVSGKSLRVYTSGKSGRAIAFKHQTHERVLVAAQKQLCAQEACGELPREFVQRKAVQTKRVNSSALSFQIKGKHVSAENVHSLGAGGPPRVSGLRILR